MEDDQNPSTGQGETSRKADDRTDGAAGSQSISTNRRGFFRQALLSGLRTIERAGRAAAEPSQDQPAPGNPPRIRRPDHQVARESR